MTGLWPCVCGAEGAKNLGTRGYCSTHLGAVLESFDPSAFAMNGCWLQDGPMRPDFGPKYAECRCLACGATAVSVVGTPCGWCLLATERMHAWQAGIVLTPPDIDLDDRRRSRAFEAWADRLAVAVEAGTITEAQARRVWEREVGGVAA